MSGFVFEVLLKGLAVTIGSGLVWLGLRRSSAEARHAVLMLGAVLLAVVPVGVAVVPAWTLSLGSARPVDTAPATAPVPLPTQGAPAAGGRAAAVAFPETPDRSSGDASAASSAAPGVGASRLDQPAGAFPRIVPLPRNAPGMEGLPAEGPDLAGRVRFVLLVLWLLGTALLLGRVLRGAVRVRMVTAYGSTPAESDDQALADAIAREAGLRRRPQVRVTHWTTVPLTWGVWRPVILLPTGAELWPRSRLEAALRHEMHHVRRWDYPGQFLAELVTAWHWPNPLAWWLRSRLAIEREAACDDAVLRDGTPSAEYASHLLEAARTSVHLVGPVQGARGTSRVLGLRLDAILDRATNRVPVSRWRMAASTVLAIGLGAGLAGATLAPPPATVFAPGEIWALSSHASPQAMDRLVQILEDGSPEQRGVAALALGYRGDPRGLPALVEATSDPEPYVRESAAAGLVALGGPEAQKAVLPLARDTAAAVRSVTSWALGELGGAASVRELIRMVDEDPDPHTRAMAAMAVPRIRDADVTGGLVDRIPGASAGTRVDLVMALGHTGDPDAIPVLDSLVRYDTSAEVRGMAVRALDQIDAPGRIDIWLRALQDSEWRVRNQALLQLARREDPRARAALLEALQDPQHQVRMNATWALEDHTR